MPRLPRHAVEGVCVLATFVAVLWAFDAAANAPDLPPPSPQTLISCPGETQSVTATHAADSPRETREPHRIITDALVTSGHAGWGVAARKRVYAHAEQQIYTVSPAGQVRAVFVFVTLPGPGTVLEQMWTCSTNDPVSTNR